MRRVEVIEEAIKAHLWAVKAMGRSMEPSLMAKAIEDAIVEAEIEQQEEYREAMTYKEFERISTCEN